jgi:NADH-quinone oxidoreductase subunit N
VNLHEIVSQLILDTKGATSSGWLPFAPDSSLGLFLPELLLCVSIVLMLLVRVFPWGRRVDVAWLALLGIGVACYLAIQPLLGDQVPARTEIFTGMLVFDPFSALMRGLLLLFGFLFTLFTMLSGVPDREDSPDIYTLVLGSLVGMCLMVSANHLLMVFLAIEMASVPSYALVALMKGNRRASEAALKYAVYGAGAAGVMLYGISLIAGLTNSVHLPTIAAELAQRLPSNGAGQFDELMVLTVGGLMMMVGLAFKLSAVPFHFWCPDVFEGATAEVDAFLSVASKAAAVALLIRVTIGLGVSAADAEPPDLSRAPATSAALFAVEDDLAAESLPEVERDTPFRADSALSDLRGMMAQLIALLAIVTCTFGNLAAYGQTNIKRLLAYSTIAHAGYMMMAVPAMLAMADSHPLAAERAVSALAFYVAVYVFMNLGAFAIVAFLRNAMHSEELSDYAGLIRHCPGLVVCLSLILFGLIGLPPLSGFLGKFAVFASLWEGYRLTSQTYLLVLLLVGGLNTAISLFYYLRVVKIMTIDPDAENRGPIVWPMVSLRGVFLLVLTAPTALLVLGWDFLYQLTVNAAQHLLG